MDYQITNKTIAIKRLNNKTIIYNVENKVVINKSIKKLLDLNCFYEGSSLDIRRKIARKYLNKKYKIPIYINEVILLPIVSLRNKDSLYIALDKILEYHYINNSLTIVCINNTFNLNISKNCFEKLMISGIRLKNYLSIKKE